MKTVYVVSTTFPHDRCSVIGVFETEEGARAELQSFMKDAQPYMEITPLPLEP
jgi:hypothetical protein